MAQQIHSKYVNFLLHQIFAQDDIEDNREGYCNAKSMLFQKILPEVIKVKPSKELIKLCTQTQASKELKNSPVEE